MRIRETFDNFTYKSLCFVDSTFPFSSLRNRTKEQCNFGKSKAAAAVCIPPSTPFHHPFQFQPHKNPNSSVSISNNFIQYSTIMMITSSSCRCISSSRSVPVLQRPCLLPSPSSPTVRIIPMPNSTPTPFLFSSRRCFTVKAASSSNASGGKKEQEQKNVKEEEEVDVEEDLPWIQEKALDLVEFTGTVTQAIPGPRVGQSSLPWILAIPVAYLGVTFVIAFVKTVRKFNSPKEKRRQLVNKNAMLCKSIDELFEKGRDEVAQSALKELMQKTGFQMEEIMRKYIRYVLNEKPFDPNLVANLIQLRKASGLEDYEVSGVLNEISKRTVKEKGPVVMDMSGYSEKGLKRKLAVQSLFGKIFYLSEMPEFCSGDCSLTVKEIFGVADEDAVKIRMHPVSEGGDLDSLERMVDGSDFEGPDDE